MLVILLMECFNNSISDKVVVAHNLDSVVTEPMENYILHALCTAGEASFTFNGRDFTFRKGDLIIVHHGRLMENFVASADFEVRVLYIMSSFTVASTPNTNYGTRGSIALFLNPVMPLSKFQYDLCMKDFDNVEFRLGCTCYRFYEESLRCAVQMLILDFFDFHARIYGEDSVSTQTANIMTRFFEMLDAGEYRQHREVTHYASKLCVTAKYLSQICKNVSGHSANFWINRYTILDISKRLHDHSLSFVQISDMFNFSSPAYFTRYVQRNLGMTPSDFRQ